MKSNKQKPVQAKGNSPDKKVNLRPEQVEKRPSFLSLKAILLSLIFIISVGMIKEVKSYAVFIENKIVENYKQMQKIAEADNYDEVEFRKELRWADAYRLLKKIRASKSYRPDMIVLLPPTDYIRLYSARLTMPEPAVCYYYAGIKTALTTTDYAYKSTHTLIVSKQGYYIAKLKNRAEIDSFLTAYKSYSYNY